MTTQSWSRSGCQGAHSPQPFCSTEFGFKEGDFPVTGLAESAHPARLAGRTSIAIPFYNHLTAQEIDYVAGVLERALGEVR